MRSDADTMYVPFSRAKLVQGKKISQAFIFILIIFALGLLSQFQLLNNGTSAETVGQHLFGHTKHYRDWRHHLLKILPHFQGSQSLHTALMTLRPLIIHD